MDKNLVIAQIKEQLKGLMKFAIEKEQKFLDITTMDGKQLQTQADLIEVGVEVFALDENGNQIPAENGYYDLEDGTVINILDGKIVEIATKEEEIKDVESPVEDASVNAAQEDKPADDAVATDPVTPSDANPMEERVANLEKQIEEILGLLQSMAMSSEETNKKVEEFAKAPSTQSISEQVKVVGNPSMDEVRTNRFKAMLNSSK